MNTMIEKLAEMLVVPVVVLDDEKDAEMLADALVKGGLPTGGVNVKNLKDYLGCSKIVCCGGSWMVKGDMIKAGEFDKIAEMTKEAVELAHSIRK